MLLTVSDIIRHGGLEGYLFVSKASSLGKGLVMGELFAYVLTKALAVTLHSCSLPHLTNVQMNPIVPSTDRQPEGQGCKPGEERTGLESRDGKVRLTSDVFRELENTYNTFSDQERGKLFSAKSSFLSLLTWNSECLGKIQKLESSKEGRGSTD